MCSSARGQCLLPWPNRIRDGKYEFAGMRQQLPLTEPERQNAIHGLTPSLYDRRHVDSMVLQAPGCTRLRSDERGIPTGAEPVDASEYDCRRPRPIGKTTLDTAFTGLQRDDDGRARVHLASPDSGTAATFWLDERYRDLMLFTGDPLPDVNRRSLGIEPMTCAPNLFGSGQGLVTLQAGESFAASWGIASS